MWIPLTPGRSVKCCLVAGLVLVGWSGQPAAGVQTSSESVAADLDAFAHRVWQTGVSPGLSIAVVRGSEILYLKGFGYADRESRRPVTNDTQFYIASTTKSFTALAASLLAERGEIDLDASVNRYLPSVAWHPSLSPASITLRNLLTMTHGIRPGGPVDLRTAYTGEFTHADLLRLLADHPPAEAGRAFRYSNLGYNQCLSGAGAPPLPN